MSEIKTDIDNIQFSSTVFLTPEDMAFWNSLSPAEQYTFIDQEEEKGFQSGAAPDETL